MKKVALFLALFSILFIGCDKGCTDASACNYDNDENNPCKYPDEQEDRLKGVWNLIDIHDPGGACLFSFSSAWNCDYDELIGWVNIAFNYNKTCEIATGPSELSENFVIGDWSINICTQTLDFASNIGDTDATYPDYWPFGRLKIIDLYGDTFLCEDLAGNTMRWERM